MVAGRASFLNDVYSKPESSSAFTFQRLNLQLLRPPAIKKIFENTYWDRNQIETSKEHCKLDDKQMTEAAAHFFKATFGHARSLLCPLQTCSSYDELVAYRAPDLPHERIDWYPFAKTLRDRETPLRLLMNCIVQDGSMDLRDIWIDKNGTKFTFDIIADHVGVVWEETLDNANLYMPSNIQRVVLASIYPIEELLEKFSTAIALGRLSNKCPEMLELLFLARFRELCNDEQCPSDVLPNYFTDKQKFGRCTGVQFGKPSCWMPSIAKNGNDSRSLHMSIRQEYGSDVTLAGIDGPSSPDILLMNMRHESEVAVSLAIKVFVGMEVTKKAVTDECKKFNSVYWSSKGRLNVLILCSVAYSDELQVMMMINVAFYLVIMFLFL